MNTRGVPALPTVHHFHCLATKGWVGVAMGWRKVNFGGKTEMEHCSYSPKGSTNFYHHQPGINDNFAGCLSVGCVGSCCLLLLCLEDLEWLYWVQLRPVLVVSHYNLAHY